MSEVPRPTTRQELYDRVRASTKDEVVVDEMIRMGFWTATSAPDDPAAEIQRIGELERKLREISLDALKLQNVETAKLELLKRRLKEARDKREETKRRRMEERAARTKAWSERKKKEILFLGDGVSTSLGKREGQAKTGLPNVQDGAAIAAAMGITTGALRFLSFHRKVSQTTHWRRFAIPKKTGGTRLISAPMPRLKAAQHWVLREILEKVPVHDAAHGFVRGRSIVTNAAAHVGRDVVVNFDLKDFFPTLTFPRVRGLFRSLGYSPEAATVLALVCTEAEVQEVEVDGRRWFVHRSERRLPQGSPCSPAITNLVCVRLDQRLTGLARKLGFTYTRYADDLTFSGSPERLKSLMGAVRAIVVAEGFAVHPDKTRILRKGACQEVTGLVVNRKLGVSRRLVKRWRAVVHQVRRDGPAGKAFGPSSDVLASLVGFAAFVHMVEPEKGSAMLGVAREVAGAHGWKPPSRPAPKPPPAPAPAPGPAAAPASAPAAGPAAARGPASASAGAPGAPADGETPKWYEFWKWFGGPKG